MCYAAIDREIEKFAAKWFLDIEDVKYEAYNFRDGELANENKLEEMEHLWKQDLKRNHRSLI